MAKVVFTTIASIDQLASAKWLDGDSTSYENTKSRVPGDKSIGLIGRMSNDGQVQLQYANAADFWRPRSNWAAVSLRHLELVKFFHAKIAERSNVRTVDGIEVLAPFFDTIDDPKARKAANDLIALECGTNVTKEPWGSLHIAVLTVQNALASLGVSTGDWTFIPMFNSFDSTVVA